jgi:tellurite resistance protein TerC
VSRFHLLPCALALVLTSIGVRMLLVDIYRIPVLWSLGAAAVTLAATVALSVPRAASDSVSTGGR